MKRMRNTDESKSGMDGTGSADNELDAAGAAEADWSQLMPPRLIQATSTPDCPGL